MKFFSWASDGGKESHVRGLFLVELKPLFSIVLLHFSKGSREAFHSHAFHAITWVLKGKFHEYCIDEHGDVVRIKAFEPSFKPKITKRSSFHKVVSVGETWALSFRGPWGNTWREYFPSKNKFITLTHGRKIVETQ